MITWEFVWKLIVSTSIVGTTLTAMGTLLFFAFKTWILNFFKKDLIRFEKNIKKELKETELKLSKAINLEENYYKSLLEEYKQIWSKINSLSRHLSNDFTTELESGRYKDTNDLLKPIRQYVFDIKDSTIFISKELDEAVSSILDNFLVKDINTVLHCLEKISKLDIKGDKELQELNHKINSMQTNFATKRDEIKILIQDDYKRIMKE
ncbi:MAG: hypothetical protein CMC08_00560 [Flavobacteriaceae bacterium]|nr:hypothetical protein [Flavobacteriaceae bacterium]|tara:strand:- start:234 stop:857 length:624 start_codon:yes stop_codon:yes gene_type:complete